MQLGAWVFIIFTMSGPVKAGTVLYLVDLVQITIHEMRYNTYHDTLQLNETMKKGLKFVQSVDVLLHVHRDLIILLLTNYLSLICFIYTVFLS